MLFNRIEFWCGQPTQFVIFEAIRNPSVRDSGRRKVPQTVREAMFAPAASGLINFMTSLPLFGLR
jgi:hypothetical protein